MQKTKILDKRSKEIFILEDDISIESSDVKYNNYYCSFYNSGMNSIENELSLLKCVYDKSYQYPVWFFLQ